MMLTYNFNYLCSVLSIIMMLSLTSNALLDTAEQPSRKGDSECLLDDGKNDHYCVTCKKFYKLIPIGDNLYKKCRACHTNEYSVQSSVNRYEFECRECDPACSYPDNATQQLCRGPKATISNDGCIFCEYAIFNSQKTCLRGSCLNNYYPAPAEYTWTKYICLKCDPNCKTCSSKGNDPIANGCECKNYWKKTRSEKNETNLCVDQCPDEYNRVNNASGNFCICNEFNYTTNTCNMSPNSTTNTSQHGHKGKDSGGYVWICIVLVAIALAVIGYCIQYKTHPIIRFGRSKINFFLNSF